MACPSQLNLVLIILSVCSIYTVHADKCKQLLKQIGDHQSKFLQHFVDNSDPAESCTASVQQYDDMVNTYANIASDSNCSDIINRNRLLVVPTMQKNLVDLWNKGFCDDCRNNDTIFFKQLETNFSLCLSNTHEPCIVCQREYLDLNNQYKQMEQDRKGKVCFDTQDAMNQTRSKWSKDLKCCRREFTFTLFFVGSSIIGILPFVFYFGMYAYTKRMERNHEVLYTTFEPESQAPPPVASTSSGVISGALVGLESTLTENTSTPSSGVISRPFVDLETPLIENTSTPAVNVTETEEEPDDVPILGESSSNLQNEHTKRLIEF